jgi:hypothetical protein
MAYAIPASALSLAIPFSGSYWYTCPKYNGSMVINFDTGIITKKNNEEFEGSSNPVGVISVLPVRCDAGASIECIKEVVDPFLWGAEETHVYAIPKVINIGSTYSVDGVDFKVLKAPNSKENRKTVQIEATPKSQTSGRYKLYVEDKVGLNAIYFERLVAQPNLRRSNTIKFDGVYCYSSQATAPFAGVRLKK